MCVHWTAANWLCKQEMCASLLRASDEIQRHKAGWLASGAHKYLDDWDPIARPQLEVACRQRAMHHIATFARARSLHLSARACNCNSATDRRGWNGCTHPAQISN